MECSYIFYGPLARYRLLVARRNRKVAEGIPLHKNKDNAKSTTDNNAHKDYII
jgi:hypothetical protein